MKITYYHNMLQGSDDWFKARLGLITASNMKLLLTPSGKIASNDKVRQFAFEIAAQRETQFAEDSYQSWSMERGIIEEDLARTIYSKNFDEVIECGLITKTFDNFTIGCSPDGLVGTKGGIEIKSRIQKYQVQTIVKDDVPSEYMLQIQTALLVTERSWWDYIQYSNGMPMYVCRVVANEEMMDKILEAVTLFEDTVSKIQEVYKVKSNAFVKCERVDHMHGDEITAGGK